MKCRAREAVMEERLLRATRTYGTMCLEAIQSEAALLLLERWKWFRGLHDAGEDRLKTFFDGQARNVERELVDNAADRIWVNGRRGRHEADKAERFEVVTDDAAYKLTKLLAYGGINAGRVLESAEAYAPDRDPPGQDGLHQAARVAWYAWLGRRAIRTWISAAGLSLLGMRYPNGKRRFAIVSVEMDFLVPLAAFARDWAERFMDVQDRTLLAEQEARVKKLRDQFNVELTPVQGVPDGVLPDGKAERAPEREIREAPEEYREILGTIGNGFGRMEETT